MSASPPRTLRIALMTRWGADSGVLIAEALTRTRHHLVGIVCERRIAPRIRVDRWITQQIRRHGPVRILTKTAEWLGWKCRSIVRGILPEPWRRRWAWRTIDDVRRDVPAPLCVTADVNQPHVQQFLQQVRPDLLILANTGVVKAPLLRLAPEGCLNIHLSRLPTYRGLASMFWALGRGESHVGVSIHYADEGIDTGDLVAQAAIPVGVRDTEDTLTEAAQRLGAELMREAVEHIAAGTVARRPQDARAATYFSWPTRAQRRELAKRLRARRRASRAPWKIRVHRLFKRCLRYGVGCTMWGLRDVGRLVGVVTQKPSVRILMYHKVCGDDLFLSIPPDLFEAQMAYLKQHYQVMELKDCVERLRAGQPLPPRAVAVTFDDGYADNYTDAYPILKRYGIPATIFLTAQYIGTEQRLHHDVAVGLASKNGKLLTWDQIRQMAQDGIRFGSHGLSHARLKALSDAQLRSELEESRQLIESHVHQPVEYFSYPFGTWLDLDQRVITHVEQCGYVGACTALEGINTAAASPYCLRRTMVEASDTPFLFRRLLAGDLDILAIKDSRIVRTLKRWYNRWLVTS